MKERNPYIIYCYIQDVEPGDDDDEEKKKKAEKRERKREAESNKMQ